MDKTRLLTPLEEDNPSLKEWKEVSKKLKDDLVNIPPHLTFDEEQLMLYTNWRDEISELVNDVINLEQKFIELSDEIRSESLQFNRLGGPDEFEALLDAIRNVDKDEEDEDSAVKEKARPLDDYELETQEGDPDHCLQLHGNQSDLVGGAIAQPAVLCEDDVLRLVRIFNCDQRHFVLHVGHIFTQESPPPFIILVPGINPDDARILLCAYTGKAALESVVKLFTVRLDFQYPNVVKQCPNYQQASRTP
ncbi:hypothetical protein EVAR_96358_1 [Eumeta japonica]|uniref:Uncharacterized protein n=1 Tax=Eumeta variegata TaxID=151549 RepID=A0A4C1VV46_EUMVA|nr:hypothetical protein EVAR_96358_1 [Eumeta japonica]